MKISASLKMPYAISSVVISDDGQYLAAANAMTGEILIVSIETGEIIQKLMTQSGAHKENVLIWQNGFIATIADAGTCAYVWSAKDFTLICKHSVLPCSVQGISIHQDGQRLTILLQRPLWSYIIQHNLENLENLLEISLPDGKVVRQQLLQDLEILAGAYHGNQPEIFLLAANQKNSSGDWVLSIFNVNNNQLTPIEIAQGAADQATIVCNTETRSSTILGVYPHQRQLIQLSTSGEKSLFHINPNTEPYVVVPYKTTFIGLFGQSNRYYLIDLQNPETQLKLPGEASNALTAKANLLVVGVDNNLLLIE